jgi:hypothetical protein
VKVTSSESKSASTILAFHSPRDVLGLFQLEHGLALIWISSVWSVTTLGRAFRR